MASCSGATLCSFCDLHNEHGQCQSQRGGGGIRFGLGLQLPIHWQEAVMYSTYQGFDSHHPGLFWYAAEQDTAM